MFNDFARIFTRYGDVPTIAISTLGPNARGATAAQKSAFIKAFTGYISRKYGKRFREFIGGQIVVQSARQVKSFYEVKGTVKLTGEAPFEVIFPGVGQIRQRPAVRYADRGNQPAEIGTHRDRRDAGPAGWQPERRDPGSGQGGVTAAPDSTYGRAYGCAYGKRMAARMAGSARRRFRSGKHLGCSGVEPGPVIAACRSTDRHIAGAPMRG